MNNQPAVTSLASVKRHLADLASKAGEFPDIVGAVRHVMGNYSETGANRPLNGRVEPVAFDGFSGEWIIPANADESRRGLYLHGGGWIAGSSATHRHLVHLLAAATGRPILLIDFRLAPEHPFPQGLQDCIAALDHTFKTGPSGASAAQSVVVFGDSAGGNLVAAVAVHAIEHGSPAPSALVMMSPALDFRPYAVEARGIDDLICSEPGFTALADVYLRGASHIGDPLVSPPAAADEVLSRFPPTLLQTTSIEYLRDQSVAFATRLWANGVSAHLSVQPDLPHAYHLFPQELDSARFAIAEIAHFLKTVDAD